MSGNSGPNNNFLKNQKRGQQIIIKGNLIIYLETLNKSKQEQKI